MTSDVRTTQRAYPAYKDSGIEWLGEIPAHWSTGLVKRYYSVELGKMLNRSLSTENGVSKPYLRAANIHWGQLLLGDVNEMEFTPAQLPRYRLEYGDLLVTEGGVTVGRSAIWRDELEECYYQNSINRVRPHSSDEALSEYLYYWMYFTTTNGFVELTANTATFGHLTQEKLQSFPCVLPPLPEQEAIARFLDHKTAQIDALIAKKEALLARLADKRTALISQAVTQGLNPTVPMRDSGIEWLGEIPAHWEVVKFRYCCSITQGQIDPTLPDYSERVLIAPNHIESGTGRILATETALEQGAISGKYLVNPGDIIYSKIRPALNKVCIADGYWLCSADMYPISISKGIDRSFMLYFLLSEQFVKLMVDESMRVAMPKVNRETLAACPVICPPQNEQREIALYLDLHTKRIDQQSAQIQSAIDKLKQYRTALITNAVTGKIDVREARSWGTEAPVSS